jgi:hypothetical protein
MNRRQRRALQRQGRMCEHGYLKKTDGTGTPECPHWCGFEHLRPDPHTTSGKPPAAAIDEDCG